MSNTTLHPITATRNIPLPKWEDLVHLTEERLAAYDIAVVNLACAVGLPDTQDLDPELCLFKLDYWTRAIKRFTAARHHLFKRDRGNYENSEAYFNTLCLITHLQRDLGVRYNSTKIPDTATFDSSDLFLHGIIQGEGGTCATLPVLYAAVGRCLGYPIKLAAARGGRWGHLFARWDDGKKRFNIEATAEGLSTPPDSYYHTGKYARTEEEVKLGRLVQSMTPREELSDFLVQRGWRWLAFGKHRQAVHAFAWAHALVPSNRFTYNTLADTYNEWEVKVKALHPPDFPFAEFTYPQEKWFPGADAGVDQKIYFLEAMENVLTDPELNARWWQPLRQGRVVADRPMRVSFRFNENHECNVRFHK